MPWRAREPRPGTSQSPDPLPLVLLGILVFALVSHLSLIFALVSHLSLVFLTGGSFLCLLGRLLAEHLLEPDVAVTRLGPYSIYIDGVYPGIEAERIAT